MQRLACAHKLFHQMKSYDLEGEKRTHKKNSYVKTYIPQSHLNPLFMFYFLWAYIWDFYHFCS